MNDEFIDEVMQKKQGETEHDYGYRVGFGDVILQWWQLKK